HPSPGVVLDAYEAGAAKEADVLDELLGPRDEEAAWYSRSFDALSALTARPTDEVLVRRPELKALVGRCVERVLELELARGETPTTATGPAKEIRSLSGIDTLLRLLGKLGQRSFKPGYGDGREQVLTHLVSVTYPADGETEAAFTAKVKAAVKQGKFPAER